MNEFKIRPYNINDVKDRFAAITQSQNHLLPWIPYAKECSFEDCQTWIFNAINKWNEKKDYCFAIINDDGQYVGEVKL